jgi:hypothetical protein
VTPDPVLVDQANILLDRPTLSYRAIPPLTTNNATIKIEKNDAEFRNLLASLEEGQGATDWFEDEPLDPRATYTAIPDVRDDNNRPLPALPKKVVVTRLPLTAETRDRQIEVRFAVPEGADRRYALRVYLASPTGTFPTTPSLTLPWSAIESAYENMDTVFDDITRSSPKAQDPYVIRKITKVAMPGVPELGAQKAFALEAVFNGYPRYRVSLVEEGPDNRELSRVEGQASFEPSWGAIVDDLIYAGQSTVITRTTFDDRVRLASAVMPFFQFNPPPGWVPWSGLIARATLPIKLMLGLLKDAVGKALARSMDYQLAKGLVTGFVDGVVGDYNLIRHPIDSYHAIKDGLSALTKISFRDVDVVKLIKDAYRSLGSELGQMTPFELYDFNLLTSAKVAYYVGYVAGMVLWQIVSTLILAAVTEGIGAVAVKTGIAAKAGALAAGISARILRALKILGRVGDFIVALANEGKLAVGMTELWKASLELADGPLVIIGQKYAQGMKTLEPALKVMATSLSFGKRVIKDFARIASLPDEAAQRILAYMTRDEGVAAKVGGWIDLYSRRTQMVGGVESNRAFREALKAAPDFPNGLSDEVAERIVHACDAVNRADGDGIDNLVNTFVQKHRNPGVPAPPPQLSTERLVQALRNTAEGPVSPETINAVIRVHSITDARAWSEDALTGAARLVEQNGTDGATFLERLVRDVTPESIERIDRVLAKIKTFTDPDAVKAFGRLVKDGEAARMAKIVDNPTYASIEEKLVRAIDRLRVDGNVNGKLIPGIATVPTGGSGASPLLNTMVNATNLGTAYEPVAILKLVDGGEFTVAQIEELGRRVVLAGGEFAEADAFVSGASKILVEVKHGGGGLIDLDQLRRQELALQAGAVDKVMYALRDGYGTSAASAEINAINARMRAAFPARYPPGVDAIVVRSSLGGI